MLGLAVVALTLPARAVRHTYVGAQIAGEIDYPSSADFTGLVVSPDGLHVYLADVIGGPGLLLFDRDPLSGALTFRDLQGGPFDGFGLVMSPDGAHVYGGTFHGVQGFSRNGATGELAPVNSVVLPGVTPRRVAISPDGAHLYFGNYATPGKIAVLARDALTGSISLVETHDEGVSGVTGLDGAIGVAVSPDGAHVYVAGFEDDAIAVFARNATTGALTFIGAVTDSSLVEPSDIAISANGEDVYVRTQSGVATFARDAGTGALTPVDDDPLPFYWTPQSIVISPDGSHVYVTPGLSTLDRDPSTGALTVDEDLSWTGDALRADPDEFHEREFLGLAVSPDNRNVYASLHFYGRRVVTIRRSEVTCSPTARSDCIGPALGGRGTISIRDDVADRSDQIVWRWTNGDAVSLMDFGDPATTRNDYALCVYDASGGTQPVAAPLAPAAGGCGKSRQGGVPSCWSSLGARGFKYGRRDRRFDSSGSAKLLAGAAGQSKILFKTKGDMVPIPTLPLVAPVTVQLQNADGTCWTATYSTPTLNTTSMFRAEAD